MASHDLAVPAEQGLRRDKERSPRQSGKQTGRGCEEDAVATLQLGARDLPAQNRDLVA
jgi:hypothetical protein